MSAALRRSLSRNNDASEHRTSAQANKRNDQTEAALINRRRSNVTPVKVPRAKIVLLFVQTHDDT